ncbi:expressed unknown protein [Seminavis robusta]|uniref:Uncharacterized protein n=1 Tax=Seminavis robusta TaxID=568900 RepID=A0A9N8DUF7_9STRA|nr:expressed unknown protein [Seminavis robusta]|eukprot:Sro359_g126000.1 n/a (236) ;mRNA; f:7765-8472
MMHWQFPGDTCESHCTDDDCWAVQPFSAFVTIFTAIGFFAYLLRSMYYGASLGQCLGIFGFGAFEFVHGLSHRYAHFEYFEYYQHTVFYFVIVGVFAALYEATGHMPKAKYWSTAFCATIVYDLWLVVNYKVTLYNIILVTVMFRLLIAGFLPHLDKLSQQRYDHLTAPHLTLLAVFINEGINCDRMIEWTSPEFPFHFLFESCSAVYFYYFVQFLMECRGKQNSKGKVGLKRFL